VLATLLVPLDARVRPRLWRQRLVFIKTRGGSFISFPLGRDKLMREKSSSKDIASC